MYTGSKDTFWVSVPIRKQYNTINRNGCCLKMNCNTINSEVCAKQMFG
jgi:ferric iron reductase protein FhuF